MTGADSRLGGSRFLPAPLHLAPALLRLHFLSLRERIGIGRAMLQLARATPAQLADCTVAEWLTAHGQSPRAIERFWGAVLVSALGESVDRSSILHAQKVFVDAYLSNTTGYELHVPRVSLGELYDVRLTEWLARQGVKMRLETAVDRIERVGDRFLLSTGAGREEFDAVIVAVTWQRVKAMLGPTLAALPELAGLERIDAAPIAGVHLWFDRQITQLPHAALVDMLSQWLFRRTDLDAGAAAGEYYYQVVISASHHIAGRERADVVAAICDELRDVFPAARDAKLLRWKMVADPFAVFSVRPGIEALRPDQSTSVPGFYLAGDWTKTGWPSTMEGAVRSGYLAAEAALAQFGQPRQLIAAELPRGIFARYQSAHPRRAYDALLTASPSAGVIRPRPVAAPYSSSLATESCKIADESAPICRDSCVVERVSCAPRRRAVDLRPRSPMACQVHLQQTVRGLEHQR